MVCFDKTPILLILPVIACIKHCSLLLAINLGKLRQVLTPSTVALNVKLSFPELFTLGTTSTRFASIL